MPIGMITDTWPSATFVASQVPPMPTSTMATSTGASANAANPSAVMTSKKLRRGPPSSSLASSAIASTGATSSYTDRNSSMPIGWPSSLIRSRRSDRCGDVIIPVCRPKDWSSASIIRAVDVLPFVPVTWITGYARCGSPRNCVSVRMRSRVG